MTHGAMLIRQIGISAALLSALEAPARAQTPTDPPGGLLAEPGIIERAVSRGNHFGLSRSN